MRPAAEIQAYIKKVAYDRGLRQFIRFNEEIVEARFAEDRWHYRDGQGDSRSSPMSSSPRPAFCTSRSIQISPGATVLPARLFTRRAGTTACPYLGKRWGVIGSGASGIQITEALAWEGCDVTQFIRRAQWVHIRENPRSTWLERLLLRLPLAYRRDQRQLWKLIIEADHWRLKPGPQREAMEREYKNPILNAIKDPELRRKLTPDYHLGCTRIPKSDRNYYEAVQLPNVHSRVWPNRAYRAQGRRNDGRQIRESSTCLSTRPVSMRTPTCGR